MPTDAEALAEHVATLKTELETAEAAEAAPGVTAAGPAAAAHVPATPETFPETNPTTGQHYRVAIAPNGDRVHVYEDGHTEEIAPAEPTNAQVEATAATAPSNVPGGAAVAAPPVATEPDPAPVVATTDSATPVLDAWVLADGENAVGKVRKLATRLLDEGKILEGDLLTPAESGAVNSVLVKAIDELIAKVGL